METLSTQEVASCLGVHPLTVIRWVDRKILKAFRTPGGHRRILSKDLKEFATRFDFPLVKPIQTTPYRVLIVDDEPIARQVLSDIVSNFAKRNNLAIHVETARDGFEAGKKVILHRPQLVILDLFMPNVDGFALCQNIKNDPETADTNIIAITGQHTPSNIEKVKKCGAFECLPKPVDVKTVHELLAKTLSIPVTS